MKRNAPPVDVTELSESELAEKVAPACTFNAPSCCSVICVAANCVICAVDVKLTAVLPLFASAAPTNTELPAYENEPLTVSTPLLSAISVSPSVSADVGDSNSCPALFTLSVRPTVMRP